MLINLQQVDAGLLRAFKMTYPLEISKKGLKDFVLMNGQLGYSPKTFWRICLSNKQSVQEFRQREIWSDLHFRIALAAVWGTDCQERPKVGRQDKPVHLPGERWWGIMYHFRKLICFACLFFKKTVVLSCIRVFLVGMSLTSGSRSSHCWESPICDLDCLPQVSLQPLPASRPDIWLRI